MRRAITVALIFASFRAIIAEDSGKAYFTQKLDHFDSSSNEIWQHRYFYNSHYATPDATKVNFLALAGEMGAYLSMVTGPETVSYVYYAKLHNAWLYALDQRFYGDSKPTEDTSIENLKYLTSRQAIEDVAEFIRQKNKEKGGEQQWIVVGGGYAGNLAAWSRMLHPELIVGAIASSAPIEAKLDFYGYFQALDSDFANIGGLCYKQISEGLDEATQLFQSPQGRSELSSIFQVKPGFSDYDVSENDMTLFFAHVISPFIYAAQNNNPTVPQLCDKFTSKGEKYNALLALRDINPYLHMTRYQRCAEFGFIQSSNLGDNVFGQTQSSNLFIDYCRDLFKITAEDIQRNVDATNKQYGGRDYFTGTNVIFTHGTIDPWTPLTKTSGAEHESVIIAEIQGGWHSSDLGTTCDMIPPSCANNNMAQVQALTMDAIETWLNPTVTVPDGVEITDNIGKRPEFPNSISDSTEIRESVIVQPWDHFNDNEDRNFAQRFWLNDRFGSSNGPNFLMIANNYNDVVSDMQNENLPWSDYAKTVDANLYLLEHRYYGDSKLGTNDLQYLSSAQMLYDVAAFIRAQQVTNNRTGPWIIYGSLYGGSLAAWSREWFPELIAGAVASSSPMLAKNDFYESLHIVEELIGNQSQLCFDRVADALDQLRKQSMDPQGRMDLMEKFNVVPRWTDEDVVDTLDMETFFLNLYSIFQEIVVKNTGNDVQSLICNYFEDTTSNPNSVDALRAAQENYYHNPNVETPRSYDEIVESYSKMLELIDGHDSDSFDDEQLRDVLWLWQTCSEFGFHTTTDYGSSIFAYPVPLNYHMTMCERVFNLTMDETESGIAQSLYQYGGRDRFNTTNVVFTNGDGDPWKALGITEQGNLDESVVPILIEGAAHSADMREPSTADPASLIAAREEVLSNIQRWIDESPTSTQEPAKTRRTMMTSTVQFTTTPSTTFRSTTTTTSTSGDATTSASSTLYTGTLQWATILMMCLFL